MQLNGLVLLWVLFGAIIVTVLTIDLFFVGKNKRLISLKESLTWTGVWISLALLFNAIIWVYFAKNQTIAVANLKSSEFLTAYLIEESLSIDNLFVFVMIFKYFSIPLNYQRKLLFFGVIGAIICRMVVILCGMWLVKKFNWIFYVFGIMLLYSAIKMVSFTDKRQTVSNNFLFKILSKIFPISKEILDDSLFRRVGKKLYVTPLFVVLVYIELSDLVFAIDSIPAVFAVTKDPFIAFTSNIFAVLGLRSVYFVLINAQPRFKYLNIGLSIILGWIGIKMLIHQFVEIPVTLTLFFVIAVLAVTAVFSKLNKN